MKEKTKRLIAVLLCFPMMVSFTTITALADDGQVNDDATIDETKAVEVVDETIDQPAIEKDAKAEQPTEAVSNDDPIDKYAKKDISKHVEGVDKVFNGESGDKNGPLKFLKLKNVQVVNPSKVDNSKLSKLGEYVYDENGNYIWWNRSYSFTLYKGQKLYVNFDMYDCYENVYTIPAIEVYDSDFNKCVYYNYPLDSGLVVDVDSWNSFTGYHNIKSANLTSGNYVLVITAMPCYSNGEWVDDFNDYDIPVDFVDIKVKKMPKPTSLSAKAGKKKVTISFKKSTGAKKYQIYRSTKKSSGYSRIATITGNKYTDKKVKKNKRYYYKVRAMRGTTKSGIAKSYFTSPKRTKKVK